MFLGGRSPSGWSGVVVVGNARRGGGCHCIKSAFFKARF